MKKQTSINQLKTFIPDNSINYYINIFDKYKFLFLIKRPRQRKLGDFKVDLKTNQLTITINNNLHPYQFHLTFLHELAHLITHINYGLKVKPHGNEWKTEYKKLITESIEKNIFKGEIVDILKKCYLQKTGFSSNCSKFDLFVKNLENLFWLSVEDIPVNTVFMLKTNNRQFKKLKKRRTRYICEEVQTKRQYLVSKDAEVCNYNFFT